MKKILLSTLLAFATLGALVSCNKDSGLTNPMLTMKTSTTTPAANPVLTYVGEKTISKMTYPTIAVMNSDGSNQTNIYTSPTSGTVALGAFPPCWSPDGKSIAWIENSDTIKAIDVSFNSNGVPVGSNLRTIYATTAGSTNFIIHGLSWCSQSGTGELAYVASYITSGRNGASTVYTISESGGTPSAVITESQNLCYSVSWSPDDSKIAFSGHTVPGLAWYLRVADASTGSLLESDSVAQVNNVEWERSGNTIAFDNGSKLYYLDYGSGNGEYTESVSGTNPTWSPDDANLMFVKSSNVIGEIAAFGTSVSTVTTVSSLGNGAVKWKR